MKKRITQVTAALLIVSSSFCMFGCKREKVVYRDDVEEEKGPVITRKAVSDAAKKLEAVECGYDELEEKIKNMERGSYFLNASGDEAQKFYDDRFNVGITPEYDVSELTLIYSNTRTDGDSALTNIWYICFDDEDDAEGLRDFMFEHSSLSDEIRTRDDITYKIWTSDNGFDGVYQEGDKVLVIKAVTTGEWNFASEFCGSLGIDVPVEE